MIYYSHVNEDSSPEILSAQEFKPEHLVCVTGSGERLIALLNCPSLRTVAAIDENAEAQYLLELKIEALKNLEVEEYLSFIGHHEIDDKERRIEMYKLLRPGLSGDCSMYWDKCFSHLRNGILNSGHFEIFLNGLRPMLKVFLGKSFYTCLSHPEKKISGLLLFRWNLLLRMFSFRWVYKFFGNKDAAFISSDAHPAIISRGFKQLADENKLTASFITHLVFKGHLRDMADFMPHSLQPEIIQQIKRRLLAGEIQISYVNGDIRQYAGKFSSGAKARTFFSLSDVLSFISMEEMEKIIDDISVNIKFPASVVFRAFIRNHEKNGQMRFSNATRLDHLEKSSMYSVYKCEI